MRAVLILAALWAGLAVAQEASPAPAPEAATADAPYAPPSPSSSDELPHWGVLVDVGIPDGLGASANWRPFSWLRLRAGASYNLLGYGVSGGISLIPFEMVVSPSFTVDVGHFFEGDVYKYIQDAFPDQDLSGAEGTLRHLGYDYVNAQVGVEIGSPRKLVFQLKVGASYLQATLKNFGAITGEDTSLELKDPIVRATFPSLKIGILAYF